MSSRSVVMTCLDGNTTSSTIVLDATRAAFDVTMLSMVIVTNAAILVVMVRRWTLEGMPLGNVTSSILVVNLSAADLLVGVFSIFYFLPRYSCSLAAVLAKSENLCILRFAPAIMAHLASGYTLVAIAGDRYMAVCYAIHYRDVITPRRSVLAIGIIWLLAIAGSMMLFGWNTWDGTTCTEDNTLPLEFTIIMGVVGQVVILGLVSTAHWKIHRKVLEIRWRKSESSAVSGGIFVPDDRVGTRASRLLALILGVYIASWAPFMAVLIIDKSGHYVAPIVFETASSFVNFNYLVNPFIYAYNNRTIQKTILKCVASLKRKTTDSWTEASNTVSFNK